MSTPTPTELDSADVERLADELLSLALIAARPFLDMVVINSTSATLVVISDIDRIDDAAVVELCVDLQSRTGEAGVLACQWQRITNESMSVHTWVGVEPTVVHTREVPLT